MKIIITERGWVGHFICGYRCAFRRNTLIEKGRKKIVVSTVGAMLDYKNDNKYDTIGHERYYETMVFGAKYQKPYWEADVTKELHFDAPWSIGKITSKSDAEANAMHEAVVQEFITKLQKKK